MIKNIKRAIKKYFQKSKINDPDVIVEQFKDSLLPILPNDLKGIYILGSMGMNDLNPKLSDIDFVVTTKDYLSDEKTTSIGKMHREIEKRVLQPNLNGIYIREEDIGKNRNEINRLTYFHEGDLHTVEDKSRFYEINPITWAEWSLFAITIYGKKSEEIKIKPDWAEINKFLLQNINSYWRKWLDKSIDPLHPYYYQLLFWSSENAWCVSGVARQLFTLLENDITSKRKSCEYLIEKAPAEFQPILVDTINFRQGRKSRPGWMQKKETRRFMQYCLKQFNDEYQRKYDD